jgi:hypothetical protein
MLKLTAVSLLLVLTTASPPPHLLQSGAPGVNRWRLEKQQAQLSKLQSNTLRQQETLGLSGSVVEEFPAQWFTQPLDHFDESVEETFGQRYWVNTRHYQAGAGGPVIVVDGGETSGEDRLPFLDHGIVDILAKATGGVGIVLEHRYYGSRFLLRVIGAGVLKETTGESIPVKNFSTDALRWLNNAQALEDSARFLANVKFAGIDEDLTSPRTPWIYCGVRIVLYRANLWLVC